MFEELAPFIGTYGFPVFVSLWFMWRLEKFISNNTKALMELTQAVKEMHNRKET